MSETVDSSSGGPVEDGPDATARVSTGGVIEAPEITGGGGRWSAKRIAATAVIAVVAIFLLVKAAEDVRQFVIVTLNGVTLAALYASKEPRSEKLAEKAKITKALRAELEIKRPVTNATLIQYKTYGSGKDELRQLFAACNEDFPRFMMAIERLRPIAASAPAHSDPGMLLRALLRDGC